MPSNGPTPDAALAGLERDLRAGLERVRSNAHEADRALRSFVVERPLLALGGAVVAGYLVARLLARRS